MGVKRRRVQCLAVTVSALVTAGCSGGHSSTSTSTPSASVPATVVTTSVVEPDMTEPAGSVADALQDLPAVELPAWEPQTRTAELLVQLGDGSGPTVQQAVDAFSLTFEEMPGATPSDLPPGDGLGASYVLALIESVREQLAPDQVAVLDRLNQSVTFSPVLLDSAALGGQPAAASPETSASASASASGLRRGGIGSSVTVTAPGGPTLDDFRTLVGEVMVDWREHRGDLPPIIVEVGLSDVDYVVKDGAKALQTAGTGGDGICRVVAYPEMRTGAFTRQEWKSTIAHELFHCVQQKWQPAPGPAWLVEGGAAWASVDLYRSVFPMTDRLLFTNWFTEPHTPLEARTYDAWPLYELWQQGGGGDGYAAIRAMLQAEGGVAVRLAVAGMDNEVFRTAWTSKSTRHGAYPEPEWQMRWPAPDQNSGPFSVPRAAGIRGLGSYEVRGLAGYGHPLVVVVLRSDVEVVTVVSTGALLRMHDDASTVTIGPSLPVGFCMNGADCECPDGTVTNLRTYRSGAMEYAFAAGPDKPTAKVIAEKFDPQKFCHRPKPPSGESNGDPHLVTLDGLPFDMMAPGEFVTARDPAGGFEVQERHVPAGAGGAGTSAVAIGTGEHRITFTSLELGTDPPVLRIDGADVGSAGLSAVGDVSIAVPSSDRWTVTWPDGSTVELLWARGFFIRVTPAADRAARLEGLLGSADGDFVNDVVTFDGVMGVRYGGSGELTDLPAAVEVTVDTTLFDYLPGESPATFRSAIISAPREPTPEHVDACGRALAAVDASARDVASCAFDLAATGHEGFIEAYVETVEARDHAGSSASASRRPTATSPAASAPPAASAAGVANTLTLDGTIYDGYATTNDPAARAQLVGQLAVAAGSVIVVRADRCLPGIDVYVVLTDPATGTALRLSPCDSRNLKAVGSDDDDEVVDTEAYGYSAIAATFDVQVKTLSPDPLYSRVDLFTDPTPTQLSADEFLQSGFAGTLSGIADTVILPMRSPDQSAYWAVDDGGAELCVAPVYGAQLPGTASTADLGYCAHADSVGTTPTRDLTIPVIVFNRRDGNLSVRLSPAQLA